MAIADVSARELGDLWSLSGRIAVVTGGAQGLGKAIGRRLAEAGAIVVLADRNDVLVAQAAAELSAEFGPRVLGRHLDVVNTSSVEAVADFAVAEYGRLDVWVNNAGVFPNRALLETTDDLFSEVQDINLKGLFVGGREAARRMIDAGGGGVIVNILSMAGVRGVAPGLAAYVASKHGARGLTRQMALELAPHDIRVLGVAPSFTPTEGNAAAVSQAKSAGGLLTPSMGNFKLGRPGAPDDIARAVLFCATDMSNFMTGSTLMVDGGNAA